MSHGHSDGSFEKKSKGLFVLCDGEAPKSGVSTFTAARILCHTRVKGKACLSCEHSRFTIQLQRPPVNDIVACPQWATLDDYWNREPPFYVKQRRAICFKGPFHYCGSCPNHRRENPPIAEEGWWEEAHQSWKEGPEAWKRGSGK